MTKTEKEINDFSFYLIIIVFTFHFTEFARNVYVDMSKFFSGHCRNLRFTTNPIHGQRLNNHVIRTIDVINEDICQLKCYKEPNCVSYNFKTKANRGGKHICDLNNATYEHDNEHSGDLTKDESYVYRGAEVDIELHIYNIKKYRCVILFFAAFAKVIWVHFDQVKLTFETVIILYDTMSDIWIIL